MSKQNDTHIRLIHADEERDGSLALAPKGFNWKKYPDEVLIDGKRWHYSGCLDAYPHYVEVIE